MAIPAFARRARSGLKRIIAISRSYPFTQSRVSQIVYATFSGVLISVGTELVLNAVKYPNSADGRDIIPGILFVIASLMFSGVAWAAQSFSDYLSIQKHERSDAYEKSIQFDSWHNHHHALNIFTGSWVVLILAFISLIV